MFYRLEGKILSIKHIAHTGQSSNRIPYIRMASERKSMSMRKISIRYAISSLWWLRHVIHSGNSTWARCFSDEEGGGIALWLSADLNNIGMSVCQTSLWMKMNSGPL